MAKPTITEHFELWESYGGAVRRSGETKFKTERAARAAGINAAALDKRTYFVNKVYRIETRDLIAYMNPADTEWRKP